MVINPPLSLNEYVETYGNSMGVYLLTQYVNGWVGSPSNGILSDIRDGKPAWNVTNGRVLGYGTDVGRAPNNFGCRWHRTIFKSGQLVFE